MKYCIYYGQTLLTIIKNTTAWDPIARSSTRSYLVPSTANPPSILSTKTNCTNTSGVLFKNKNCKLYRINGIEDHIHIMSDLHPSVCLSDYVKDIKVASSIWMKESGKFPDFEGWQIGYGAFTYSIREKDMIINYIKNQKAHHQKENFYN